MKHSEVKERIIETASSLFYQNGYNSTGINEIIAESGVAKATLYNHFKSKEDICVAYLQLRNATFLDDIHRFAQTKAAGEERLLAIYDFLQLFFQDRDFNGCWCIKTVAEIPKENEKIRRELQKQKNDFLQWIETTIGENLPSLDAEAQAKLARRAYLLYEGAVVESHLHQADWPIHEARAICAQILP